MRRTGLSSADTITGSSIEPPVATSRIARASWSPSAIRSFKQVRVAGGALGEQRDGVLGVVVLAEDHDTGAGMTLADLLAGVDALRM